ncbi:Hsp20/alpha crystallin family protein [Gracilimonas tropica]|uniref:Hsp20/alpha crystallin family protein n=1 Tax=Gracilimonas tropica TaxID=454600 RepID=UPI0014614F65|nr:Hsp20/alpha crystallin family protein [Gracilimonas tropica]
MKTLAKHTNPSSPIESIKRQMDRFFDDLTPFTLRNTNDQLLGMDIMTPDTDMMETEKEYVIAVDLPGFQKKDIEINYQDNRLIIKGTRKEETKEEKPDYLHRERYFGEFIRTVTMPTKIKEDKIKASFKDGVLTVKAPKVEVSHPKVVAIE